MAWSDIEIKELVSAITEAVDEYEKLAPQVSSHSSLEDGSTNVSNEEANDFKNRAIAELQGKGSCNTLLEAKEIKSQSLWGFGETNLAQVIAKHLGVKMSELDEIVDAFQPAATQSHEPVATERASTPQRQPKKMSFEEAYALACAHADDNTASLLRQTEQKLLNIQEQKKHIGKAPSHERASRLTNLMQQQKATEQAKIQQEKIYEAKTVLESDSTYQTAVQAKQAELNRALNSLLESNQVSVEQTQDIREEFEETSVYKQENFITQLKEEFEAQALQREEAAAKEAEQAAHRAEQEAILQKSLAEGQRYRFSEKRLDDLSQRLEKMEFEVRDFMDIDQKKQDFGALENDTAKETFLKTLEDKINEFDDFNQLTTVWNLEAKVKTDPEIEAFIQKQKEAFNTCVMEGRDTAEVTQNIDAKLAEITEKERQAAEVAEAARREREAAEIAEKKAAKLSLKSDKTTHARLIKEIKRYAYGSNDELMEKYTKAKEKNFNKIQANPKQRKKQIDELRAIKEGLESASKAQSSILAESNRLKSKTDILGVRGSKAKAAKIDSAMLSIPIPQRAETLKILDNDKRTNNHKARLVNALQEKRHRIMGGKYSENVEAFKKFREEVQKKPDPAEDNAPSKENTTGSKNNRNPSL